MPSLVRSRTKSVSQLGNHRQQGEQQPAYRFSRVVHRRADAELDLTPGEILEDLMRVGQRSHQAIELGHDKRVASATRCQRLPQAGALAIGARQPVVDVDAIFADPSAASPSRCAVKSCRSVETRAVWPRLAALTQSPIPSETVISHPGAGTSDASHRVSAAASTSARTCVAFVSLDSAARSHYRAGDESDEAADDGGGKAKLDHGKRSSWRIGAQADDQPNDGSDRAHSRRAGDCPPRGQRRAP
jgi:hypothetical protein